MHLRFVPPAAAALFVLSGALAGAQQPSPAPSATLSPVVLPTLAPNNPVTPYANALGGVLKNVFQRGVDAVRDIGGSPSGTVTYFKGYDMQIQTGANAFRTVHLHKGTEIDPRGATIRTGQHVSITGQTRADNSVDADRIVVDG